MVLMPKRRKCSVEFKQGGLEQLSQSGVSCAQVIRELGISRCRELEPSALSSVPKNHWLRRDVRRE